MKKNQRKWGKRGLTLLVVLAMCLSTLSLTALADVEGEQGNPLGDIGKAVDKFVDDAEDAIGTFGDDVDRNGTAGGDAARENLGGALEQAMKDAESAIESALGDLVTGDKTDIETKLGEIEQATADGNAAKDRFEAAIGSDKNDADADADADADIDADADANADDADSKVSVNDAAAAVDSAVEQAKETNANLETAVEEANGAIEDAEAEAEKVLEEVQGAAEAKDKADKTLQDVQSFADDVSRAASDPGLTQGELDALNERAAELAKDVLDAKEAVKDAESGYDAAAGKVKDLADQLEALYAQVDAANQAVSDNAAALEARRAELEAQLSAAETELAQAKAALDAAAKAQKDAEDSIKLAEKVMDMLQKEHDDAADSLKEELEKLKQAIINEAEAKLEDKQAEERVNGLEPMSKDERDALPGQADALEGALNTAEGAKAAYDDEVERVKKAHDAAAALEAEYAGLLNDDRISDAQNTVAEFESVKAVEEAVEKLQEDLKAALSGYFSKDGLSDTDIDAVMEALKDVQFSDDGAGRGELRKALAKAKDWADCGTQDKKIDELRKVLVEFVNNPANAAAVEAGSAKAVEDILDDPDGTYEDARGMLDAIKGALGDAYVDGMDYTELLQAIEDLKSATVDSGIAAAWENAKNRLKTLGHEVFNELNAAETEAIKQAIQGMRDKYNSYDADVAAWEAAKTEREKDSQAKYNQAKEAREQLAEKLGAYFNAGTETAEALLDLILAQAALNKDTENTLADTIGGIIQAFTDSKINTEKAEEDFQAAQQKVDEARKALKQEKESGNLTATGAEAGKPYEGFASYREYLEAQLDAAEKELALKETALNEAKAAQAEAEAKLFATRDALSDIVIMSSNNSYDDYEDDYDDDDDEVNVPEANVPGANAPEANVPGANTPEANVPGANAPEANVPGVNAPEANTPEANAPEADAPEANAPEADAPVANAPVVTAPAANAPEADDALVDIADADVPLAGGVGAPAAGAVASDDSEANDALVDIADEDVPLAGFAGENASETASRSGMLWIIVAVVGFSGVGAAAWLTLRKKTRA